MTITIDNIAHHRNGISGQGVWFVLFTWTDDDGVTRNMLGTVFNSTDGEGLETDYFTGYCAVLDRDELAKDNIAFARGNSWRGDQFEGTLRAAIVAHQQNELA